MLTDDDNDESRVIIVIRIIVLLNPTFLSGLLYGYVRTAKFMMGLFASFDSPPPTPSMTVRT